MHGYLGSKAPGMKHAQNTTSKCKSCHSPLSGTFRTTLFHLRSTSCLLAFERNDDSTWICHPPLLQTFSRKSASPTQICSHISHPSPFLLEWGFWKPVWPVLPHHGEYCSKMLTLAKMHTTHHYLAVSFLIIICVVLPLVPKRHFSLRESELALKISLSFMTGGVEEGNTWEKHRDLGVGGFF